MSAVQEITLKWEKLRSPDIASKERTLVVHEILDMVCVMLNCSLACCAEAAMPHDLLQVQGRVADLAMSHTASRVIQACAKHGSDSERQQILTEVTPRVVDLAKSSYGHFLLCKLITAAPKKQFPGQTF